MENLIRKILSWAPIVLIVLVALIFLSPDGTLWAVMEWLMPKPEVPKWGSSIKFN
jgi:hypothetical protein